MVKVVSIISRMNIGGPAILLSELVGSLPTEDFEHTLITGSCLPNEVDYLDTHFFPGSVIKIDDIRRSILPISDIKSFVKITRVLRNIKPDIVHTHTSKAGLLGRLSTRLAYPRAKVIHTYHGHLLYGYFPKWKTKLLIYIERTLGKISHVLVGVTEQVVRDLSDVGIGIPSQWRVILPGIADPVKNKGSKGIDDKSSANKIIKIIWIGRFTGIKNPQYAIQIFEELYQSVDLKVELTMVGAGELLDNCKNYASNKNLSIRFTGWVSDASSYLDESDFLLMTSLNEGMPIVIIEAAARGVPVFAPNVGGISEFIVDQSTGVVIPLENVKSATSIISQVLENRELVSLIKGNVRRSFLATFTTNTYVKKHIDLYKEVTNES